MVVRLMFGLSRGRDDDDPSLEFILNHVLPALSDNRVTLPEADRIPRS